MGSPIEQAMRYNQGKLQWDLVDFPSLEGMVRVLEFGAQKYDRDNWKKGLPMRAQCSSIMRHLVALFSGEIIDPETGIEHYHHIMCNAMFMAHTMKNHPHHNDLPKPAGTPGRNSDTGIDQERGEGTPVGDTQPPVENGDRVPRP